MDPVVSEQTYINTNSREAFHGPCCGNKECLKIQVRRREGVIAWFKLKTGTLLPVAQNGEPTVRIDKCAFCGNTLKRYLQHDDSTDEESEVCSNKRQRKDGDWYSVVGSDDHPSVVSVDLDGSHLSYPLIETSGNTVIEEETNETDGDSVKCDDRPSVIVEPCAAGDFPIDLDSLCRPFLPDDDESENARRLADTINGAFVKLIKKPNCPDLELSNGCPLQGAVLFGKLMVTQKKMSTMSYFVITIDYLTKEKNGSVQPYFSSLSKPCGDGFKPQDYHFHMASDAEIKSAVELLSKGQLHFVSGKRDEITALDLSKTSDVRCRWETLVKLLKMLKAADLKDTFHVSTPVTRETMNILLGLNHIDRSTATILVDSIVSIAITSGGIAGKIAWEAGFILWYNHPTTCPGSFDLETILKLSSEEICSSSSVLQTARVGNQVILMVADIVRKEIVVYNSGDNSIGLLAQIQKDVEIFKKILQEKSENKIIVRNSRFANTLRQENENNAALVSCIIAVSVVLGVNVEFDQPKLLTVPETERLRTIVFEALLRGSFDVTDWPTHF